VNSSLYGQNITIPKEVIGYLEVCFNHIPECDPNTEGYKRNQELRNSGYVTYQQLGRIKSWFDNYGGDGKDAPYVLNGADYMKNWVDRTIDHLRSNDNSSKTIDTEFMPEPVDEKLVDDMGWLSDMNRPSKEHSKFSDDVKITESLKRINNIMKKLF